MLLLRDIAALRAWRESQIPGRSIGFVPTMGALHAGHAALVRRARAECRLVVASVFVNPTQFNNAEDFAKYPNTLEADCAVLEAEGCDALFLPTKDSMYPDGYRYRVTEERDALLLEGAFRPGHFDGVLTVVLKLFNLVQPHRAYFGEKDWQQLALVRDMAAALFLPLEVVPCPTVREADGLAMSSRNTRLTPAGRALAPAIHRALTAPGTCAQAQAALEAQGFKVEYVVDHDGRRLTAAWLDGVRLIDNVPTPSAS